MYPNLEDAQSMVFSYACTIDAPGDKPVLYFKLAEYFFNTDT